MQLVYTPILIRYIPSVLTVGDVDSAIVPEPIRLLIEPPISRLVSAEQGLPAKSVLTVPSDGVLKFKLLPSNLYQPNGVYKVSILTGKNKIATHVMQWVVPEEPNPITLDVIHQEGGGEIRSDYFEILSVSRSGTYQVIQNKIIWLSNPPAIDEMYTVRIQPAITLNQLIVDERI